MPKTHPSLKRSICILRKTLNTFEQQRLDQVFSKLATTESTNSESVETCLTDKLTRRIRQKRGMHGTQEGSRSKGERTSESDSYMESYECASGLQGPAPSAATGIIYCYE